MKNLIIPHRQNTRIKSSLSCTNDKVSIIAFSYVRNSLKKIISYSFILTKYLKQIIRKYAYIQAKYSIFNVYWVIVYVS